MKMCLNEMNEKRMAKSNTMRTPTLSWSKKKYKYFSDDYLCVKINEYALTQYAYYTEGIWHDV